MASQTNFADCYVLTPNRTPSFIRSFLDHFLPQRSEYSPTYEVPQAAEQPTATFHSEEELLHYLEQNTTEPYTLYWSNTDEGKLRGAMCLYTPDGHVILNLFCETRYPDDALERRYLQELMDFCASPHGLIEYEMPAPRDATEFMKRIAAQGSQKVEPNDQ